MKLLAVNLENFRQHKSTKVTFYDGVTGIIGPNGSGKSTVMESIAYALYGSKALRGKVDTVKSFSASKKDSTSVELTFEHGGQNYKLVRTLSDAKLYIGGGAQSVAEGSTVVTNEVIFKLGMTHEEFIATYFTEQKSLEFLSGKKGATEREKFIIRMMGYDKLQKVQDLLRLDRRDIKNEIIGLDAGIGNKEEIESKITEDKQKLDILKDEEKDAVKVLEKAVFEEEMTKKDFNKLNSTYKEYQELSIRIKETEVRLDESEKRKLTLQSEIEIDEKDIGSDTIESKNDINNVSSKLAEELEKQDKIEAKLIEEISKVEKAWNDKLNEAKANLMLVEREEKNLVVKIKEIKRLQQGGDCPTCGQVLGKEFSEVQLNLEKELVIKEKDRVRLKKKEKNITSEPKGLSELREKLDSSKANISDTKDEISKTQMLMQKIKEYKLKLESLGLLNERIVSLNEGIAKHTTAREKIDFSEDGFEAAKNKYEVAKSFASTARLQKVRLEGKIRESSAMLKRSEEELFSYKEKESLLKTRKSQLLLLEDSDLTLTNFRKYINDTIKPRLAELTCEFLTELSDGRYTTVDISEDFTPTVYEDGNSKTVISGGEEDLLNLCLRLALSSLIAERSGHSFSLLVLDEVFGSLDESRRTNVLSLLERLQNRFEQILVITHLDDVKEGVRNLLYVDYDESTGNIEVGEQHPDLNFLSNI